MSDSPPTATLPALPAVQSRHNGNRTDPRTVQHVIQDLADGDTFLNVARRYSIGLGTVQGIARANGATLASQRAIIADNQDALAAALVGTIESNLLNGKYDECNPNELGLTAARLLESSNLLRGAPTQRIEVSVNLGLDDLRAQLAKVDAVIDVTPEPGK